MQGKGNAHPVRTWNTAKTKKGKKGGLDAEKTNRTGDLKSMSSICGKRRVLGDEKEKKTRERRGTARERREVAPGLYPRARRRESRPGTRKEDAPGAYIEKEKGGKAATPSSYRR